MSCERMRRHLDDWLDDGLPEPERAELERHVRACAACRSEAAGLRRVLAAARALPGSEEPGRDLWPSIRGRLERPGRASSWRAVAAAAALAAAVLGGWALRGALDDGPGPAPTLPVSPRGAVAAGQTPPGPHEDAEAAILAIKRDLRAALARHRDTLAPETARAVDRNLEIVDRAIEDIRTALERDPGNRELTRMLMAAHRREVLVLQHATRAATRL